MQPHNSIEAEQDDREYFSALGERLSAAIPDRTFRETHGQRASRKIAESRRYLARARAGDFDPIREHQSYVARVVRDTCRSTDLAISDGIREAEANRFAAITDAVFSASDDQR